MVIADYLKRSHYSKCLLKSLKMFFKSCFVMLSKIGYSCQDTL